MELKSYRIQVSNIMKDNIERALTAMGIVGVAGVVNRMAKGYYATRKRDGSMNPQIRQTSALMQSITSEIDGNKVNIGTNNKYARYVHDGTRYMKARPFLVDGVNESIDKLKAVAIQELSKGK